MYRFVNCLFAVAAVAADAPKYITPPAGVQEAFRAHAVGYQVYACDAGKWSRSEPIGALVTAQGQIIRHFRDASPASPAWDSMDGSKVNAVLKADGSPDQSLPAAKPNSIPQLGLNAQSSGAPGIFSGVTYVVRTNTGGGVKPAEPCQAAPGKRVSVYYESDYVFYKKVAK